MRRMTLTMLAALCVFAVGAVIARPAPAATTPGVIPPSAHPFGKTYDEWAAAWWQWSLSIALDHNPMVDDTGANAAESQNAQVWFLAGIWGGNDTVERTCTVPAGKALFFPIFNNIWVTTPGDYLPNYSNPFDYWADNEGWIREYIRSLGELCSIVAITVDGKSVPDTGYRVSTPEFMATFPEKPVWTDIFTWGVEPGVPAGPSIDEGSAYLMLVPLSVGTHTIYFHTFADWFGTPLDQVVTYHLTVVPAM
jgi:hypothetical protein